MRRIEAILFEPVGCLAEFPSELFQEIACRVYGAPRRKPSRSGSRAYWHLLNLMEAGEGESIEAMEMEASASASVYEDVIPALAELKAMGARLHLTSSLTHAAVKQFVERHRLRGFFDSIWSRDNACGVKTTPLRRAVTVAAETIFLTDTLEGLKVARSVGVNPILMMNDPDEARRLAMHEPAGGIVSLHELPDFLRLLLSRHARLA